MEWKLIDSSVCIYICIPYAVSGNHACNGLMQRTTALQGMWARYVMCPLLYCSCWVCVCVTAYLDKQAPNLGRA